MSALTQEIIDRWMPGGEAQALGAGHIHGTWLVVRDDQTLVLQRVNTSVFTRPELVMQQAVRVQEHWAQQTRYAVPRWIASVDGHRLVQQNGEYWRAQAYLASSVTINPLETIQQVREVSTAFAAFQAHMAKFPAAELEDTIPGFLQLDHYLDQFAQVEAGAPEVLRRLVDEGSRLSALFAARNTCIHGDCKVDNCLFDSKSEKAIALIDFDTVMHGHWAWDFGDLVRSVCTVPSHKDEPLNLEFFGACVQGFSSLPIVGVQELVLSPQYVALMLGVRFLTDHLSGDVYFRVDQPGDNLKRAHMQFALYQQLVRSEKEMMVLADDLLGVAQ